MTKQIKLNPADFVPMDIFENQEPIVIDLVYQNASHPLNIFQTNLYHAKARLWLHKNMAAVVLLAARILLWHSGKAWKISLKDGLRTIEAQAAMQDTDIVRKNPDWQEDGPNRLLSPPGKGAHPRGLAIDMIPTDQTGSVIDMGTVFDEMNERSSRNYQDLPPYIVQNRLLFERCVQESAILMEQDIIALPSEWWDFRHTENIYGGYQALSDHDLPPQMQMHQIIPNKIDNFPDTHFESLAQDIISLINQHNDYL